MNRNCVIGYQSECKFLVNDEQQLDQVVPEHYNDLKLLAWWPNIYVFREHRKWANSAQQILIISFFKHSAVDSVSSHVNLLQRWRMKIYGLGHVMPVKNKTIRNEKEKTFRV